MKTKGHRTFVRFQPSNKDIGHRFNDEEFAQEFIEPIKSSIGKERTPSKHCREGHERYISPKE
ncbi:MAG: hypothetical protein PHW26_07205 [Eubacteriales bacterium]|nr:hypothetical protein [Eubacteriales bacterium]